MFASSRTAFASANYSQCYSSMSSSSSSSSSNNGSPVVLTYYSQLSDIVSTIIQLLYNFSIGNFDYVNKNFTQTTYYNLSIQLHGIQQDASIFPEYENIRTSITRALEGLQQAMTLYNTLQSAELELEMTKRRASILDNMTELSNYIKSLGGAVSIFQDVTVTAIAATVKPEIAIYIKLYGYPEGGVFDMDRLANAISLAEIQAGCPCPC